MTMHQLRFYSTLPVEYITAAAATVAATVNRVNNVIIVLKRQEKTKQKKRKEKGTELTLLTATADDVLQEGVLRGHEAPPSSRHHYFDWVYFRNVGAFSVIASDVKKIILLWNQVPPSSQPPPPPQNDRQRTALNRTALHNTFVCFCFFLFLPSRVARDVSLSPCFYTNKQTNK